MHFCLHDLFILPLQWLSLAGIAMMFSLYGILATNR